MSEIILNKQGEPVEVFVDISYDSKGRMIVDAQLRSADKATMIAGALASNLLWEKTDNTEYVVITPDVYATDEETGERVLVAHEVGEHRPLPNTIENVRDAHLDHIGAVELTPAVKGADGEIVTPAVMSEDHCANLRMQLTMLDKVDEDGYPNWMVTTLQWMKCGVDTLDDKGVPAKLLNGVELLGKIKTPARTFAASNTHQTRTA